VIKNKENPKRRGDLEQKESKNKENKNQDFFFQKSYLITFISLSGMHFRQSQKEQASM